MNGSATAHGGAPGSGHIRILRLLHFVGMEGGPYNQYSVAAPRRQEIALCSFFPHEGPPVHPRLRLFTGDGTLRGYLRALREAEEAWDYDLVHAHTPHVAFAYLVHAALGRIRRRPRVYTLHSSYPLYNFRNRMTLYPVRLLYDRFVCCGEASLESLPRLLSALGRAPARSIPNGVDLGRVDAALEAGGVAGGNGREFVAAAVNRLVPGKHTDDLLRVVAALPDLRLRVMGWGPERERLEELIQELGVGDRVTLLGRLPREEVHRRLRHVDLFVSASSGEGLPNAVLEAMACGVPAVLSDIRPHREIDPDGACVSFVPPGDEEGFVRAIRDRMALPPEERSRLGDRGRDLVEERFDVDAMNRAYDALFDELVNGPGGQP